MKILIFGGTTEGRILAEQLGLRHRVTVSVATPLGAEELKDLNGVNVLCGRMSAEEMEPVLQGFDRCIDATHPYADLASREIRRACDTAGIPLLRLSRPASRAENCLQADDCREAAELVRKEEGNVLVTTGTKDLNAFSVIDPERLYARVLPTHESLNACESAGLSHGHIIAMQGPFSEQLNRAILEQLQIRWVITKDGGEAGGFQEKQRAAEETGAGLILVRRPPDEGISMEEILKLLEEEP
ncbi:MAG: precorrin-6A reductase [Oscillospiraceae bacterium]|nr:precorrin-6A reductase [Oscillospiraceae bacterium]